MATARQFADDLDLALRLADQSSFLALSLFHRGVGATRKPDGSVVTEADIAVEQLIVAGLASERPGDAVIGEEFGGSGTAPRRWIIDPIDGTRNFVAGRDDWGIHIALECDGEIVVGVVTRPVAGMRWWARRGGGAFRGRLETSGDGLPLRVSDRSVAAYMRVCGWLPHADPLRVALSQLPGWIESRDLNAILDVVEGSIDVLIDGTASRIWDRAPFVVLVEEAGGTYADHGGTRDLARPGGVFTNGKVDPWLAALFVAPSNRADGTGAST